MNQNNIIPSDPEETERDEPPASNYTPYKNKFIKIKSNQIGKISNPINLRLSIINNGRFNSYFKNKQEIP